MQGLPVFVVSNKTSLDWNWHHAFELFSNDWSASAHYITSKKHNISRNSFAEVQQPSYEFFTIGHFHVFQPSHDLLNWETKYSHLEISRSKWNQFIHLNQLSNCNCMNNQWVPLILLWNLPCQFKWLKFGNFYSKLVSVERGYMHIKTKCTRSPTTILTHDNWGTKCNIQNTIWAHRLMKVMVRFSHDET